jgi:mono/diheme cytochrome c family protein
MTPEELVDRGDYLVNHVAACPDCHTPRNPDGSFQTGKFLAGAACFVDIDPATDDEGCIHTANLTDHETGLRNRSDAEIKDMFLSGTRPNGEVLHSVMPYWVLGNMTDEDADAIVAYLRTVDGVDNEIPNQEPPWDMRPEEPATRIDLAEVPAPDADYEEYDAAMRGRYLATQVGVCMECHTPENPPGSAEPLMLDMAFAGGRVFPLGPDFAATSRNLTSDATGLEGWTKADIVNVLHEGIDKDGKPLCPPMPAGPMGAFGGLTDDDAEDIAAYILSLPPIENEVSNCELPSGPPAGEGGAGGMPAGGGAGGADGASSGAGGASGAAGGAG